LEQHEVLPARDGTLLANEGSRGCRSIVRGRNRRPPAIAFAALLKGGPAMEFRWVVIITLWTLLSAPVFDNGPPSPHASRQQSVASAATVPGNTPQR
jgi:hypothetical protein